MFTDVACELEKGDFNIIILLNIFFIVLVTLLPWLRYASVLFSLLLPLSISCLSLLSLYDYKWLVRGSSLRSEVAG